MHAKSLQSCPTLCKPMDFSPPPIKPIYIYIYICIHIYIYIYVYIYICVAKSLCYAAEINTTLQINYTSIKDIFKRVPELKY